MEESVKALRGLGLSPRPTVEVITAVDKYVMGHVSFEVANHSAAMAAAHRSYFDALLATGEFPELSRVAGEVLSALGTGDEFERGLSWLLDGVAASISS